MCLWEVVLHAFNVESHEEGCPFFFVNMVVSSPELVPAKRPERSIYIGDIIGNLSGAAD